MTTRPDTRVEMAFDLSAIGGDFFTLNDPTLGQLDNAPYGLGGSAWIDVTDYVRAVNVRRGRSRRLDKSQTGSASIVLDNRDRRFDPGYTIGPYSDQVRPRRQVRISTSGAYIFTGLVEDWNYDYDVSGDSIATASCVDGFVLLAGASIDTLTPTEQRSGARVSAVLDLAEVSWPAGARNIDAGSQDLQADTVAAGTNALTYLQLVEETEAGALYVARDGVLTFRSSSSSSADISTLVLSDASTSTVDYDDAAVAYDAVVDYDGITDPTGVVVPYRTIQLEYGTETLYNRVTVSRVDGGSSTADDATSQAAYGVSALSREGLLSANDTQVEQLANFLLSRYANPAVRVRSASVDLLSSGSVPLLVALDFGDIVRVRFTPNGIRPAFDQLLLVEGLSHDITPGSHTMTLSLDPVDYLPFELDSADWGVLDTNRIGL